MALQYYNPSPRHELRGYLICSKDLRKTVYPVFRNTVYTRRGLD